MIQEVLKKGRSTYKVRVYARSSTNPNLRITKQIGNVASLSEAKKEEVRLKKECERELLSLELRGILFGDLLSEWHEHMIKTKVKIGSRSLMNQQDYYAAIKKWFGFIFLEPASEINSYALNDVFNKMKDAGLSFGHRKKIKSGLKSVFDFGIQSGFIKTMFKSPTVEVHLGKSIEKKPEILRLQEIQQLIQHAYAQNHPWKRIWHAAILTGARSGELFALLKSDVDFENKLININKSHNSRLKCIKSTKAGYWRQIPISTELERVLQECFLDDSESEYVFPRFWQWERGLQAKVLRSFCYINGLPSIRFHTLRACFATQMLRLGVEPAKVMKVCGWKELKTMQRYVRLAGIEINGITEAIEIYSPNTLKEVRLLRSVT